MVHLNPILYSNDLKGAA